MASSKEVSELKYLWFPRVIAINIVLWLWNLYQYAYAKLKSGPLKSIIGTLESAVTAVVAPVYQKFKGLPDDVLVFLDNKIDIVMNKLEELAPPFVTRAASKAKSLIQIISPVYHLFVAQIKLVGLTAAIKVVIAVYKPIVLAQVAIMWYKVNQNTIFHFVAQMALPTIAHLSETYNKVIAFMSAKGYTLFSHFPSIPIDEMVTAYKVVEAAAQALERVEAAVEALTGRDSDEKSD